MKNITKTANGGYFKIEWGVPVFSSDQLQDYWEVDENGYVCKINVQLLYNSDSDILTEEPEILKLLHQNKNEKTELIFSEFLKTNKHFGNIHQSLFEDNIIFSYQAKNEFNDKEKFIFKQLAEGVNIIFNEQLILRYLIIENISTFNYLNIDNDLDNIDSEIRRNIIKLYFSIYTYNQNNKIEIKSIIDKITNFIKNTHNLDKSIIKFLNEEIFYLNEELE
ncbi:hypothetical protein [Flavobacterium aestivum]|uniref:hypothetical protein n=1 Tax=Flavobacterium aestivum TaxID=3003257 RepID=UPI002285A71D|nr:hypothetical protein [Flavobacterium aestivum]